MRDLRLTCINEQRTISEGQFGDLERPLGSEEDGRCRKEGSSCRRWQWVPRAFPPALPSAPREKPANRKTAKSQNSLLRFRPLFRRLASPEIHLRPTESRCCQLRTPAGRPTVFPSFPPRLPLKLPAHRVSLPAKPPCHSHSRHLPPPSYLPSYSPSQSPLSTLQHQLIKLLATVQALSLYRGHRILKIALRT